ncbi:quinone oxidoreductase family protein [Saccharothrix sp. ST-888]|uniref:quinone oxidoreductase family protein n=1 Tax=Saccharothrix sp. ST-888 TaxID=1427391 RepID=UPI0005EC7799|nr:zinc-binding dehydrogenase [Saccharothrix sp. ST-888]KJK56129.1 alcohol dehydrogenase [Saccharothrix sp. ST-888]
MRAVVIRQFGGADELKLEEDYPDPLPRPGHRLIDVHIAGVNYADLHGATDTYLAPVELPYILGNEFVGTTPEGRRVAALTKGGGYAEKALAHRAVTWDVPDDITDEQAAHLALQGNSAWHILLNTAKLTPGETVVIPAAAGGLGTLAVQLAKLARAKVIALASTPERRALALELGADAALDSSTTDGLTDRIIEAAGGPVQVALEMTGGPTLHALADALAPRGRLAVYGYASGQIEDISMRTILERSLTVSGFWLPHLYALRTALPASMNALYGLVRTGDLRLVTGHTYALGEAAQAHRDLADRKTTGKLLLDIRR